LAAAGTGRCRPAANTQLGEVMPYVRRQDARVAIDPSTLPTVAAQNPCVVVGPSASPAATSVAISADVAAKLRAAVAASTTPSFNSLGKPLPEAWHPYVPAGELLVAVRLHIDGTQLDPPSERSYTDELLWNVCDAQISPEAFARITCEEEDLPQNFADAIAMAIKRAVAIERHPSTNTDPQQIELSAERNGMVLHDRLVWDASAQAESMMPVESFAQKLTTDLSLPMEMSAAVAIAMRYELQKGGNPIDAGSDGRAFIRTEKEALEWSPILSTDRREPEPHDFKSADRRDRYRARMGRP